MSETMSNNPLNQESSQKETPETSINQDIQDFLTGKNKTDDLELKLQDTNETIKGVKLDNFEEEGKEYQLVGYEKDGQRYITALEIPSNQ